MGNGAIYEFSKKILLVGKGEGEGKWDRMHWHQISELKN